MSRLNIFSISVMTLSGILISLLFPSRLLGWDKNLPHSCSLYSSTLALPFLPYINSLTLSGRLAFEATTSGVTFSYNLLLMALPMMSFKYEALSDTSCLTYIGSLPVGPPSAFRSIFSPHSPYFSLGHMPSMAST